MVCPHKDGERQEVTEAILRVLTCAWRITISPRIPQVSRPATIPRWVLLSFSSRTFIYRLSVGPNGPKNEVDDVNA